MQRLFFMFLAVFALVSCAADNEEKADCKIPLYGNEYYDSANVNADYPCFIDGCGNRVCNTYDDIKDQYRNYYMSAPCQKQ